MYTSTLIPRFGERIEQLDTAIFSGSPACWRYPACIIQKIKVDRSGDHLWFRMRNISLGDFPGQKDPAFLFCYNKRLNFYVTVEGDAAVTGLAGDLGAPRGWQDPIFANQTTYLIRMEIRCARTYFRPALPDPLSARRTTEATIPAAATGKTTFFPDRSYLPPVFIKKPSRFNWAPFF